VYSLLNHTCLLVRLVDLSFLWVIPSSDDSGRALVTPRRIIFISWSVRFACSCVCVCVSFTSRFSFCCRVPRGIPDRAGIPASHLNLQSSALTPVLCAFAWQLVLVGFLGLSDAALLLPGRPITLAAVSSIPDRGICLVLPHPPRWIRQSPSLLSLCLRSSQSRTLRSSDHLESQLFRLKHRHHRRRRLLPHLHVHQAIHRFLHQFVHFYPHSYHHLIILNLIL
jgi:hypothetical protein